MLFCEAISPLLAIYRALHPSHRVDWVSGFFFSLLIYNLCDSSWLYSYTISDLSLLASSEYN